MKPTSMAPPRKSHFQAKTLQKKASAEGDLAEQKAEKARRSCARSTPAGLGGDWWKTRGEAVHDGASL